MPGIYLGGGAAPISFLHLGDQPIRRAFINGLVIYDIASTTLTQPWDANGFLYSDGMSATWTLRHDYTAFVFMRGEPGEDGGDFQPNRPPILPFSRAWPYYDMIFQRDGPWAGPTAPNNAYLEQILEYDRPIGSPTTNWGIFHAKLTGSSRFKSQKGVLVHREEIGALSTVCFTR